MNIWIAKMLLIMICIVFCCTIGYTQNITPEQAKQAIKDYENNQSLQLDTIELRNDSDELGAEFPIYTVLTENTDWDVDAVSGEVLSVQYNNLVVFSEDIIPQTYTQNQCYDTAVNYVRQKYTNFDNMGFQIDENVYDTELNNWCFVWNQKNGDIYTYNRVLVSVRPDTGQIVAYSVRRTSNTSIPTPQVTATQARDIAVTYLDLVSNIQTSTQGLICSRNATLYWLFTISGDNANDEYKKSEMIINAVTGSVIKEAPYSMNGAKGSRSKQKIVNKKCMKKVPSVKPSLVKDAIHTSSISKKLPVSKNKKKITASKVPVQKPLKSATNSSSKIKKNIKK